MQAPRPASPPPLASRDAPPPALGRPDGPPDHYPAVARVLARVLLLNLTIALAKIVFGYATGTVSILSDGFHSLTDSASNVVGLAGIHVARKPPDPDHPYGHRKYETIASVGIAIMLLIVMVELLRTGIDRLSSGSPPPVSAASFLVMLGTLGVNIFVVRFERVNGERLGSELLLADSRHTQSDMATSLAVIVALLGIREGLHILDPLAALVVACFIGYAGYSIMRETSQILSDRVVIAEEDLMRVVMSVPHVLGCHQIRTRGASDHVFLDLHVWLEAETPLIEAHEISHVVKNRLMARYPQIVDAIIHIEPPPWEMGKG